MASIVINFTVSNVADSPVLTAVGNHTVNEDALFHYDVNATDGDLHILSNNIFNIVETLNFTTNETWFNINMASGLINQTFNVTYIGNHSINITVNDSTGTMSSEVINFTILEIDDAPILNPIGTKEVSKGALFHYDVNATDEEDGGDDTGNLTFRANETWFLINSSNGLINQTFNITFVGQNWINITVNDSAGGEDSEVINFTVRDVNSVPTIGASSPAEYVNIVENSSQLFLITGNDNDTLDTLNFSWYLDEELNQTSTGSPGSQKSFTYNANFSDEGYHNLTIFISDGTNETFDYWNITVNHTNSPPDFYLTIQNISWNQDSAYTSLDLDSHFRDVDNLDPNYNQTINYTWIHMNSTYSNINESDSRISVSINNNTNAVTFTPDGGWTGLQNIYLILNDSELEVFSNNVTLNVTEVESSGGSTSTGSGGGGGSSTSIASLDIVLPSSVTIYPLNESIFEVTFRNTGDVSISSIDILGSTDNELLRIILSKINIGTLTRGQSKVITVTLNSGNLPKGGYTAFIYGSSRNPKLNESAELYIEIRDPNEDKGLLLEQQIKFTKDLFEQNPECLELNELITRSRELFNQGNYDEGLELVNSANQECKDILIKEEIPGGILQRTDFYKRWEFYLVSFIALLTMVYLGRYYIERRKFKKGKE
ncbi:hypothetical protein K8R47_02950 [archaeon]|nr:hypothetical protein [archaeon]